MGSLCLEAYVCFVFPFSIGLFYDRVIAWFYGRIFASGLFYDRVMTRFYGHIFAGGLFYDHIVIIGLFVAII